MKLLLPLLVVTLIGSTNAQDSSETLPKKFTVSGYIKNLQTANFGKSLNQMISGNLLHNRLNVKWKPSGKITTAAEFRNRLFWGEEVRNTPGFGSLLRNENEKANMQKAWIQNASLVLHTNIERLYFDYNGDKANVRIGRQRMNWGITTTWNPNDLFNTYNFLDFDYEERPGSDGGKVQYRFTNHFNTELAYAQTGKKKHDVIALKHTLNKWNYDMQLITGWYHQHLTIGAGWAGSIDEAGFKGEVQYFTKSNDSADHFNLTLEADYMFPSEWYLNAGMLFNSNGISKSLTGWNELNLKLSPENLMPTKWNFMTTTTKAVTPLFSTNVSLLYSPGSNLLIILPSFSYNLSTNFDINLVWQSFFAELSNNFEAVNHRCFLRMKWSF